MPLTAEEIEASAERWLRETLGENSSQSMLDLLRAAVHEGPWHVHHRPTSTWDALRLRRFDPDSGWPPSGWELTVARQWRNGVVGFGSAYVTRLTSGDRMNLADTLAYIEQSREHTDG